MVTYMLLSYDECFNIWEYISPEGKSYFSKWFKKIDAISAAKVTSAIYKLGKRHFSNVKHVGGGVLEFKINYGPGYRIYFSNIDNKIILLLGGTKKEQNKDIKMARRLLKNLKNLFIN